MKRWVGITAALAALTVLSVGALGIAPAVAGETEEGDGALVGRLTTDDDGAYVLVEVESGDEYLLEGEDLEDHVDTDVEVIGRWETDEEGNRVFMVSSIRALD